MCCYLQLIVTRTIGAANLEEQGCESRCYPPIVVAAEVAINTGPVSAAVPPERRQVKRDGGAVLHPDSIGRRSKCDEFNFVHT